MLSSFLLTLFHRDGFAYTHGPSEFETRSPLTAKQVVHKIHELLLPALLLGITEPEYLVNRPLLAHLTCVEATRCPLYAGKQYQAQALQISV